MGVTKNLYWEENRENAARRCLGICAYENHPTPQPKHGRGLSYNPSSSSLMRVYLPLSLSTESVACQYLA